MRVKKHRPMKAQMKPQQMKTINPKHKMMTKQTINPYINHKKLLNQMTQHKKMTMKHLQKHLTKKTTNQKLQTKKILLTNPLQLRNLQKIMNPTKMTHPKNMKILKPKMIKILLQKIKTHLEQTKA